MRKTYDLGSYVALDDISITDGRCDEPVTCDFDDDICSYGSSNQKYDFDFARFVGEFSICFLGLKDSFIKQHFSTVVPNYFSPIKSFNNVDLPAPFGPTIAILESYDTSRSTSFNIVFSGEYPNVILSN